MRDCNISHNIFFLFFHSFPDKTAVMVSPLKENATSDGGASKKSSPAIFFTFSTTLLWGKL